jgi:ParB-like chromosome segregation protein Spo0J
MTHTHTNKRGARYRYYVSHAVLQKRKSEAGSIARVPAADIESEVVNAVRERLESTAPAESPIPADDRELVERYVDRVVIKRDMIEVRLSEAVELQIPGPQRATANNRKPDDTAERPIAVPWSAPAFAEIKGILHSPSSQSMTSLEDRDRLLTAIAKARNWIDDLAEGRVTSFDEIAKREGKVVRHIRLLAPLAFVSPQVIEAIIEQSASADLKVTSLAKMLPHSWRAQERRIGL